MILKYITIFIYAVGLYIVSFYINLLLFEEWILNIVNRENFVNKSFDYIVVGSGSAGSVVALRLSESPDTTVLVLEAGSNGGKFLNAPMEGPAMQRTAADWQYKTVPQTSACFGLKLNQSHWPAGRIVGGSMYLNNLLYVRGHPNDYENWFGDDYTDVLKYFKKSEDQRGRYSNDSNYHARGGPLIVDDIPFISKFGKAVLKAAETLGYPIRDVNAKDPTGFMKAQVNIRSGERHTTAHYLLEQQRPNVVLLTQALVHKVILHLNFEARGVKFSRFGYTYNVRAKKGVVLSAGTIGSPKILMHSGIGPRSHLEDVGIKTKIDLPVGHNLQDHVTTGLDLVLLNSSIDISMERSIAPSSLYEYIFHGRGPLSSPGCEAIGLIDFDSDTVTDLQLMVIPLGISADGGLHLRKILGISDESNLYFKKLLNKITTSIVPVLLHPKSVGFVRLRDSHVTSHPIIDPRYLQHPSDVETLIKGIALVKKLLQTEPMQKLGASLNTNKFPGCETPQFDTREYWECYVRHLTLTSYHPIGTCKMGKAYDTSSVVERNFKVRMTNKLFVADASVMPSLPSGNINAAVVMLAEKAGEAVLKEVILSTGVCEKMDVFMKLKL